MASTHENEYEYNAKKPDIIVPSEILFDKNLDDAYRTLYGLIYFFCNDKGFIWHKNESLAESINKSDRAIRRGLKALSDTGYITILYKVKANDIYKYNHERVIWITDKYEGMKKRQKLAKEANKPPKPPKQITLPTFKKLIRKQPDTPFYELTYSEAKLFSHIFNSSIFIGSQFMVHENLLCLDSSAGKHTFTTQQANQIWQILHEIFKRDRESGVESFTLIQGDSK